MQRRLQRLPIAGELQGALADGGAEGLVGGDGVEPFGLRFVVGSQDVKQAQGLTLRSQLWLWSAPCQRSFGIVAERLSLEGVECERCGNPKAAPKIQSGADTPHSKVISNRGRIAGRVGGRVR